VKLWKRILFEKRAIIWPLAIVLIVNAGVYSLVVYPLGEKSASAEARAEAAAQSLAAAERDLGMARGLVTGKSRAEDELATFYQKVLPADWIAARNMTYTRVPDLAQQANLRMVSRHTETDPAVSKNSQLGCLKTRVSLQGDYEGIRRFVYEFETGSDFVIIDEVSLAQIEANKPLTLTLELSTYYRLGANGT
jgi:hypothetical protein